MNPSPENYGAWPLNGCTLAEARERTADLEQWASFQAQRQGLKALAQDPFERDDRETRRRLKATLDECAAQINQTFRTLLRNKRLIAFGRPGSLTAEPELIPADIWPSLINTNWDISAVGEPRKRGTSFYAVRVYPVLSAPNVENLLHRKTLVETFRSFVLEDPEVVSLARRALKLAPEYEQVFGRGFCNVHGGQHWPLGSLPERLDESEEPEEKPPSPVGILAKPPPRAVRLALGALSSRYSSFLELLRTGVLEAHGLPTVHGYPDKVPRAIWSHARYYLDPACGDVLELNAHSDNLPSDLLRQRWRALELSRPKPADAASQNRSTDGSNPSETPNDAREAARKEIFVSSVIAAGSLTVALAQFVFKHPDVEAKRKLAHVAADAAQMPFEDNGGLVTRVFGHDDKMLPIRRVNEDPWTIPEPDENQECTDEDIFDLDYRVNWPPDLEAFYGELNRRIYRLFRLLQRRELVAYGHTADGHLVEIAQSIWSHQDFYIQPYAGDLYEAIPGELVKRWTGIVLKRPEGRAPSDLLPNDTPTAIPPRPSSGRGKKSEAVRRALKRAGIDLQTSKMSLKEIASSINQFLDAPPRSGPELEALTKMIARLRTEGSRDTARH